ncbi:pyrolysin [Ceratobasidium sp. AG-Ba]|nr:pyrolysin [Ceratobasidium sp. AG-Ba]
MRALVVIASVVQLVAAAVDAHSALHKTTARYVEGSYLVGTNGHTHLARGFATAHAELEHDLRKRGVTYTITRVFSESEIWNGVTVQVDDPSELVKIAQATAVTSINRNYLHDLPKRVAAAESPSPGTTDKLSTHQMTGVDKMHAKGVFGKGIIVGIIDTGIDYTHPALGGGFGAGYKVIGGYDFVGDAYNGTNTPQPDNDPLDQCSGHGTHVAGILGADPNNPYNISGVAYEASINAYRVFGCTGHTADDVVIAALNRAYSDNNDIISLSLGAPSGWSESTISVVASNIADKGRVVTIAAGNNGLFGSWYANSPATGINTISVGSVDNNVAPVQNATDSTGRTITYFAGVPLANGTFPIYATSTNISITDDACNPLPDSTPDLSHYLVVIRRGICYPSQKLANAAAKGAKQVFIYDNTDEELYDIFPQPYHAALISKADGEYLVQTLLKKNGTVTFHNNPVELPSSTGGLMSIFSNYGPSYDMHFGTSLAAPGGDILSTFPVPLGSYAIDYGTSMAAPFMAGAAALYLQVKGKTLYNAQTVRVAFQNTASYIPNSKASDSLLETGANTGAGLVQVYDGCYSTGLMLPSELLLNDTANFAGAQTVTMMNSGTKAVSYTITHLPAGTILTLNGTVNILGPVPQINAAASVTIKPSSIIVQPGQSGNISLAFTAPAGLDATAFPVYSGFIQAKGDDGSVLHSSYLGVAAALRDMQVLDHTNSYLGYQVPFIANSNTSLAPAPTTFSMRANDTPTLVYRLLGGSPLLRVDLLAATTNITSHRRSLEAQALKAVLFDIPPSKRNLLDMLSPKTIKAKIDTAATETPTLGSIDIENYIGRSTADPDNYDRNAYRTVPVDKFLNGTAIPDGSYKLWLRAWRIDSSEVESWTSSVFTIKRQ